MTDNNNLENPNTPYTFTAAHQNNFANMISTIIELQTHVKELTESSHQNDLTKMMNTIIELQAHVKKLTENSPHDFAVRKPEIFTGKRKELSCFLGQCQLVFDAQPGKFPSDYSKIIFISSHFCESAFNWIQPYISSKKKKATFMTTYDNFIEELECAFGEPDIKNTVSRQIDKLYQTNSAANYSTEFLKLSSILNWDDEALSYHYYRGLKDEVKDQMTHHPKPKDLTDLIQISIDADNRVYERNIERPRNPNKYYQNSNNNNQFNTHNNNSHAMELDGTSMKRSPINNEERKRRLDNNLCLYCASPDHRRIDCTARIAAEKRTKNYLSATTTTIPNADSKNYQTQCQ